MWLNRREKTMEKTAVYEPIENDFSKSDVTDESRKMLVAFADLCLNSEQFEPQKLKGVNNELKSRYECLRKFLSMYPKADFYFDLVLEYFYRQNMFLLGAENLSLDYPADQGGLEFLERKFQYSTRNVQIPGNEITPKIVCYSSRQKIAKICWADFEVEPENVVGKFDVHPAVGILMRYVLNII